MINICYIHICFLFQHTNFSSYWITLHALITIIFRRNGTHVTLFSEFNIIACVDESMKSNWLYHLKIIIHVYRQKQSNSKCSITRAASSSTLPTNPNLYTQKKYYQESLGNKKFWLIWIKKKNLDKVPLFFGISWEAESRHGWEKCWIIACEISYIIHT